MSKNSATSSVWGLGAAGTRKPPAASGSNPVSIVAGSTSLVQGFRRLGIAAASTVTGTQRVGSTLTGTHATFGPTDDVTKTGVWLKVTNEVVTSVGTGMTYTLKADDRGSTVVFRTDASHPTWGLAFADTPQVEVKGTLFTSATTPVITGDVRVGATLKGAVTSVPEADAYRYDWYADGEYRRTSDASGEYIVQAEDVGKRITLMGYADKTGYERIAAGASESTAPVAVMPGFEIQALPVVTGTARVGSVLVVAAGRAAPVATQVTHQWLRNGQPIAGATGDYWAPLPSDAGSIISIVATYSGPARVTTTSTSGGVMIASATPVVTVKAKQGKKPKRKKSKRAVTLTIAASAPGVLPLTGKVVIRDGRKVIKTVSLQGGKRTVALKLKRGEHQLKVTYLGGPGVSGASATRALHLR